MSEPGAATNNEIDQELLSLGVACEVLQIIVGGSLRGQQRDTVDPDAAIDGVLMALASVLEQAREFPTQQSLRKAAEQFGKQLAAHAKTFRQAYEATGVHPIDRMLDRFPSAPTARN